MIIKAILLVAGLTVLGSALGFAIAMGWWELTHSGHAPEDFSGAMLGLVAGAPAGACAGFFVGAILASRWFRHPDK